MCSHTGTRRCATRTQCGRNGERNELKEHAVHFGKWGLSRRKDKGLNCGWLTALKPHLPSSRQHRGSSFPKSNSKWRKHQCFTGSKMAGALSWGARAPCLTPRYGGGLRMSDQSDSKRYCHYHPLRAYLSNPIACLNLVILPSRHIRISALLPIGTPTPK